MVPAHPARTPPPQRRAAPALLLALTLAAAPAHADTVYVLNSGEASISVLDGASRLELRRIPMLREPHHLVLTPDRQSLVVADSGGNELHFLDPVTGDVQRRERISNPYHLDYSPDGRWLVIASLRRDQVDLYDAVGPRLVQRLRLPDKPSHLAFSPDSRVVYVTLQGTRAVAAISLETRELLWQVDVGPEPAGILWHRGRLLVGIMGSDHIAVLNPDTRLVERRIPIGRGAHTVFPAPDGATLYATSRVESRVTTLDPNTLDPVRVFDIPGGPDCLAFAPDGRVWMTLRWVARVGVLDPATGAFETIRVGRSPHGIFVQPRTPPVLLAAARGTTPGMAPPGPAAASPAAPALVAAAVPATPVGPSARLPSALATPAPAPGPVPAAPASAPSATGSPLTAAPGWSEDSPRRRWWWHR